MSRSILLKGILAVSLCTSTFLCAGDKISKNQEILKQLSNLPFIKNGKFVLKKLKDMGDVYAIKASHPRMSKLTMFVTKDKKLIILGNGFNKKGQIIEFPIDMKKYDKDVLFTIGNGTKDYYVFTDPECPFCQGFEKKLVDLKDDVKLHVLLFPLSFHKHAISMSKYIISKKSSEERAKAISDIAYGNKDYQNAKYSDAENIAIMKIIDKNKAIAQEVGVPGTPAVYTPTGKSIQWPNLIKSK